jgi:hypothetical protein
MISFLSFLLLTLLLNFDLSEAQFQHPLVDDPASSGPAVLKAYLLLH